MSYMKNFFLAMLDITLPNERHPPPGIWGLSIRLWIFVISGFSNICVFHEALQRQTSQNKVNNQLQC